MNEFHKHLPVISLLPLPVEVQKLIAKRDDVEMRRALAASVHTDPAVLNMLMSDQDRQTHHVALRRGTDTDRLVRQLRKGSVCCTEAVARNPHTDPDHLAEALRSDEARVRLAAYVNPSTPLEDRSTVDAATVESLVDVGSFLGESVVRGHEAVLNNRHLLNHVSRFGKVLRRAVFGIADLTRDEFDTLAVALPSNRQSRRHPLSHARRGAASMDNVELLRLNSSAADLWLANDPSTDATLAQSMMTRKGHHVDPHVIGRLLGRFGTAFIPGGHNGPYGYSISERIAGTRVQSTAWSHPMGALYNHVVDARTLGHLEAFETATKLLGDDVTSFDTFLSLAGTWNGTIEQLRTAVAAL